MVRHRYEWLYVYAFLHPSSGRTHWLLLPTVSVAAFNAALAHFAHEVGAGPDRHILLVLDQAGWHASPHLIVPPGIELVPLPAYSPELQPAERLWPLTNEPLANRSFATRADLDVVLGARCVALSQRPDLIRSYTRYHWWPPDA